MENLPELGLARNIGVCNFSGEYLMAPATYSHARRFAAHGPHDLRQHQAGCSSGRDEPLQRSDASCQDGRGVRYPHDGLQLLRSPIVSLRPAVRSAVNRCRWIELNSPKVDAVPSLLSHPTIKKIADAHSKTAAQVLLRWATQRDIIVIPKSSNPTRLAENLNSTDFDLTKEEMDGVTDLDMRFRFNNPAEIDVRIGIFS